MPFSSAGGEIDGVLSVMQVDEICTYGKLTHVFPSSSKLQSAAFLAKVEVKHIDRVPGLESPKIVFLH